MKTRAILAPLAVAGLCVSAGLASAAEQTWRVSDGVVSVSLFRQIIQDSSLELIDLNQTGKPRNDMEEAVGFSASKASDLEFTVLGGSYHGWTGGAVRVQGGFSLRSAKGLLNIQDFSIVPRDNGTPHNLFIVPSGSVDSEALFDLGSIKVNFDKERKSVLFGYADLILSHYGARRLGRPDLANQILGMVTFSGSAVFAGGDPNDPVDKNPVARPTGLDGVPLNGDIQLFELYSCSSFGRLGAYPAGISGLGMATTSCNVSTIANDSVNWYSPFPFSGPMDERHPVISMNMYRLQTVTGAGSRLEHIGVGWVKHGFTSLNSSQCASCSNPGGNGNYLFIRCSDTYGASLNASRNWLGPRNEINALTGRWECTGSYFANYQNDCVERFSTGGLNDIDHRLQVRDQDLLTANSQFFYEAYYVSENDADRYNSAGWRRTTPTWSVQNNRWNFADNTNLANGVLIDTWGQMQPAPRSQPQDEGDILVAVEVTDLGNGTWHYEYAMYNHTSDRQVRTFSVPLAAGANVTNIGFHDPDFDANNDWRSEVANGAITWSTDTFAVNPDANALEWSSLYNFRFDANVPPENGTVGQVMFKPGVAQSLATASRVPTSGQVMPTLNIERGILMAGNVNDLLFSDDSRLQLRPGPVFSTAQNPISMVLEGTSPLANPASMTFRYEGQATATAIQRTVEAYNFSTGQWVVVNTGASTTDDSATAINIANAGAFVEDGTNKVRVRLGFKATGPVFSYPWTARVDRAVWDIQ